MGYRILVIGDDPRFYQLVRGCTDQAGFDSTACATGSQALRELQQSRTDLAVLDSSLADMSGLAWLRMVRQTEAGAKLPVVVASARRVDEEMAEAYDLGADDYILKTFDSVELLARVRAVLRRRFEREEQVGYAIELGPVAIDPARHECRVRGKIIDLRPREFELLEILMRKAGRVLSRIYLLETIWGMSGTANTRAVDVGISRLRQALGRRAGRWVRTVERYGYRFMTPEEP